MQNTNQTISSLIQKFLFKNSSPQEEDKLRSWLDQDIRNQELLDEFKDADAFRQDVAFLKQVQVEDAWRKQQQLSKKASRKSLPAWFAAAAILLCVGIAAVMYQQRSSHVLSHIVPDKSGKYANDITAGTNQATLILSDGAAVTLNSQEQSLQEIAGTNIKSTSSEISYTQAESASKAIVYNTLVVPRAGNFKLTLADGTRVWLNANSSLRYPVNFTANTREVFLEGEAFFEVSKDVKKPFIVNHEGKIIEVLGTHFNVNAYGKKIKTTLFEGSVRLNNGSEQLLLKPGEQGLMDSDKIAVSAANLEKARAWTSNNFYFKSDHIHDILNQIARWYDLEVVVSPNLSSATVITGNISRDANLSEVLEMLNFVSNYRFNIKGTTLFVYNK